MGSGETARTVLPVRVRCLSIHADYQCRHSGACCTAGWPIPLGDELRDALRAAHRQEGIAAAAVVPDILETAPCPFFAADSHRCAIHRELGPRHKPAACRHFPRVALLDARGVSLTLSHFCPTAASMLFREDVRLAVVQHAPAFPASDEYEGLDARDVLPPLLRPGLLWDLDGYSAWEEQAVLFLGQSPLTPVAALNHLRYLAGLIEQWTPGAAPLREHVGRMFRARVDPRPPEAPWREDERRAVNRYLAARLFASWVPYKSPRLSSLIDDLDRTLALLTDRAARVNLLEAFRATDFTLLHTQPAATERTQGTEGT